MSLNKNLQTFMADITGLKQIKVLNMYGSQTNDPLG